MTKVSVHEAKTNLSRLIEKALQGEEVIIARGNDPVVRLQPVLRKSGNAEERVYGSIPGLVRYMAPDFGAPLDDFQEYMGKAGRKIPKQRRKKSE